MQVVCDLIDKNFTPTSRAARSRWNKLMNETKMTLNQLKIRYLCN